MKRSEMLVKMQRIYGIRHCMVECNHLTVKEFMDEILSYMEEAGMLPPPYTHVPGSPERPTVLGSAKTWAWESEDV